MAVRVVKGWHAGMIKFCLLAIGVAFGVFSVPSDAKPFLIQGEVGRLYAAARPDLIKKGDAPVSQISVPHRDCTGYQDLCSAYPELGWCAMDKPLCRFEWKSKAGTRFYIITSSNDSPSVAVLGMDYDDPDELQDGSVR